MQQGPTQLFHLPLGWPTVRIELDKRVPYLLHLGQATLETYNMQVWDNNRESRKDCKVEKLSDQHSDIHHIRFGDKNTLYSVKNSIKSNSLKKQIHNSDIRYLEADHTGIVLTACEDRFERCVKITSTSQDKIQILNQYNFHYQPITALFWQNSLSISADASGEVALWDINRCQTIQHRKVHYQAVRFIGTYSDFNSNNVYYTCSPSQKRIVFSDLRTNKPISLLSLSSPNTAFLSCTSSGKVFVGYESEIDIIDIYSGYKIIGNFHPMVLQKINHTRQPELNTQIRKITCMDIMNKYLIVGTNHGNIQVYDTDRLQCLYGFGLAKRGLRQMQTSWDQKAVVGLDEDGHVYMAKFESHHWLTQFKGGKT